MTSTRTSPKSPAFEVGPNYTDFKTLGEGAYGIVWYLLIDIIISVVVQRSIIVLAKELQLKNRLHLNIKLFVSGPTVKLKFCFVSSTKMYV